MAKRKVRSQIANLTPDPISLRVSDVRHTVEKISMRVTTLLWTSFQSKVCTQSYWAPKLGPQSCGSPNFGNFGTKCHLDVGLVERHIVYYKGEGGGFPQVWAVMNLVSPSLSMAYLSTKSVLTMH
jgi:hypothetical protein